MMIKSPVNTNRDCPVCGSRKKVVLYEQKFEAQPEISLLTGYLVVACQECGMVYADRIPDQSEFDYYYEALSKYDHPIADGDTLEIDYPRLGSIAEKFNKQFSRMDTSILDIGCGDGGLLAILKSMGYKNIMGLDPSPNSSILAKRFLSIDVKTGNLFSISDVDRTFDVIIVSGVLEHIRDVQGALQNMRMLLNENGCVFAVVPDTSQFQEHIDAPFQEFSMEHVNFFAENSLTNLFTVNGFGCVKLWSENVSLAGNTSMPIITGVYKNGTKREAALRYDNTIVNVKRYIRLSNEMDIGLRDSLKELADAGTPIIVWGTGTFTLRLLTASDLGRANIRAFIDSNPHYQGKLLHGIPILAPEKLVQFTEPILISTRIYQTEILQIIRRQMSLSNPVILMYPDEKDDFE
jgi:SAM-dependent methyltransferase